MLYPLFVHNIGALLYHPANQARQSMGNATMAARRPDQPQEYMRTPQGTQPPPLSHHQSMSTPVGAGVAQPAHSIAPQPTADRPGLDRAQTFPTPPHSATSLTMGMGNAGNSYEYSGGHGGAMHSGQPLSIDTGVHARSVPTTPATTPPNNSHGIQYQTSQPYDPSRQMYSAQGTYAGYPAQQPVPRYGGVQSSPGAIKNEMGPPSRSGTEHDHPDVKHHDSYGAHEVEAEHDGHYTHSASYDARRPMYNYKPNSAPGPMHGDPAHVSPEMNHHHSPHQPGSGRATPRTAHPYTGYATTPQRATHMPQSNLSHVMSNDTRGGAPNGQEAYSAPAPYQPPAYAMNGAPPSNKRMREDDEQDPYGRPISAGGEGLKRQRTDPGIVSSRPISQPHSLKAGGARR